MDLLPQFVEEVALPFCWWIVDVEIFQAATFTGAKVITIFALDKFIPSPPAFIFILVEVLNLNV